MAEAQITKALALQAAAAAAAAAAATQQRASFRPVVQGHQPLVPIRVDVTSSKQNLRIIDTLLLDPQVWPVPLVFERYNPTMDDDDDDDGNNTTRTSSRQPLLMRATEDSIEANVRYLAHNILTDAEVQGMGRTTRHFTGRAELWSLALQEVVMDQIRPQMVQILAQNNAAEIFWNTANSRPRKKKLQRPAPGSATKKAKTTTNEENNKPDQPLATTTATAKSPPPSCYVPTPLEQARFQCLARAIKASASTSTLSLIPIRIRMSVHGIRIHDDFMWDPNLHLSTTRTTSTSSSIINSTCTTALEFARITGKDLNLPEEAIQAMAVDIVEQIHGLTMCPDSNNNSLNNKTSENNIYKQELLEIIAAEKKQMANNVTGVGASGGGSSQEQQQRHKHNITAAWLLDSRKHAMDAAHLVSQHRPNPAAA